MSPHTMGLECPRPGTSTFHRTCSPAATFHFAGAPNPSPMPRALVPRNDGQSTPGRGALSAASRETDAIATANAAPIAHDTTSDIRGFMPLSLAPPGSRVKLVLSSARFYPHRHAHAEWQLSAASG